jgi:hypothetical protein
MIISIDGEKAFYEILYHKSSEETRNKRIVSQHNKGIYSKAIANAMLNGKKT